MAETLTAHYGWTKPDPGASANTWGATLNATTDKIDAQVYTNQQAGVPIGGIIIYGSLTPPVNFILCDGRSLATTGTYAALFAAIGYTWGGSGANFNIPNLVNAFPYGVNAGLGQAGGEINHVLSAGEMPSHQHSITDQWHAHGVNQWYHDHSYSQQPHGHGVNDPQHQHGNTWNAFSFGSGAAYGIPGGATPIAGATAYAYTNISIAGQYAAIGFAGVTSAISIQASPTYINQTNWTGGSAAHNNMPPYLNVPFMIRYQ